MRKIRIKQLIEEMDIQFERYQTFMSLKNGKFVTVSAGELCLAEDEPLDTMPEWQQEEIELAIDVLDHFDEYKGIPSKFDINEYQMMVDFC